MGLPEGTRLRAGDIITLRGTVRHDQRSSREIVFVDLPGCSGAIVDIEAVVTILMRRFQPGERVRYDEDEGTVLAVHGGYLWLNMDRCGPTTVPAKECVLALPDRPADAIDAALIEMPPPSSPAEEIA